MLTCGFASGESRTPITAECVRKQLSQLEPGVQEIAFAEREVTGRLDLGGVQLDRPVRFTDCNFTDEIVLTGACAATGIRLERCKILSLNADRLDVDGELVLEEVRSHGEMSLRGARFTGHLRCTCSKFSPHGGKAFNAKGMIVQGSLLFDGRFSSMGEFILTSARIRGIVDMSDGSFSNTVGPALVADGIRVEASMFLGTSFKGPVILKPAHVSGKINCSGDHFVARSGKMAIDAGLIEADGVFLGEGLAAIGKVNLDGDTVTGRLSCNGGTFYNPGGTALSANGLECRDVRLSDGFTTSGQVSLIGAVISRELNCTGGTFDNKEGAPLRVDGPICKGKILLDKTFHAFGEILLRNARITTELNCTDATFENGKGNALSASGLTCGGNVYPNEGFWAARTVKLVDVTVTREPNCEGGKFGIFDARGLAVGAKSNWKPSQSPEGVELSFVDVGLMPDIP